MKEQEPKQPELTNKTPDSKLRLGSTMPNEGTNNQSRPPGENPGAPEIIPEVIKPDEYQDLKAKEIIKSYNEGNAKRGGKPAPEYVNKFQARVQGMMDRGEIASLEAQRLFSKLDDLLIEAEEKQIPVERENPQIVQKILELKGILGFDSNPEKLSDFSTLERAEVLEALKSDNPDFESENSPLKELKSFINNLDVSDTHTYHQIVSIIASLKTEAHGGSLENRQISEKSRKLMFEWFYENLIGRPDKGSPEKRYNIGSFELLTLLDRLDMMSIKNFDSNFATYISNLNHVREVMHNLQIALKYGDQYKEFVISQLSSSGLDFVHNSLGGVNQVIEALEKVSAYRVADKKEWFEQGDIKIIEDEVGKLFSNGMIDMEKEGRKLMSWERDRALRLAKIFFAGTQRMGMYSAMGDLPPTANLPQRIASIPYEYIGRSLVNFKVIAARFFAGENEAPRRFMEMILEEWGKDKRYVSLFGLDRRTIMLDDGAAADPQSHSWRFQEMFFDPIRFLRDGKESSLYQLLAERIKGYEPINVDPTMGAVELKNPDKDDLSRNLRDYVLGQRLYLSILPRYVNFNESLKTEIWQKIALLKPSTIASFLPDSIKIDKDVWESFRLKLYAAELKRVSADSKKAITDIEGLTNETKNFERIRRLATRSGIWTDEQYTEIINYMGMEDLNDLNGEQRGVLQKLIRYGLGNGKTLANARMPFAFAIDDAPTVAWAKTNMGGGGLSDPDLIRLLASDQESIAKGWGEMNSLVENPTQGVIEHFAKAVNLNGSVHGRYSAQKTFEPFIVAYMKFVSTDKATLFIPGKKTANRLLNKATSEIERYFRSSYLSMDESERKDFLVALAQAGAIEDNITRDKFVTQLDRIRKETDSDQKWLMIFWIRTIVQLLGPIAGKEFIKLIMPNFK